MKQIHLDEANTQNTHINMVAQVICIYTSPPWEKHIDEANTLQCTQDEANTLQCTKQIHSKDEANRRVAAAAAQVICL